MQTSFSKILIYFLLLTCVSGVFSSCGKKTKTPFHLSLSKSFVFCQNALNDASEKVTTEIITYQENPKISEAENAEIKQIYEILNSVETSEHVEPDGSMIEGEVYKFVYLSKCNATIKLEVLLYYFQRFSHAARIMYLPVAYGEDQSIGNKRIKQQPLFLLPLFFGERNGLGNQQFKEIIELEEIRVPVSTEKYAKNALKLIRQIYYNEKASKGYWRTNYHSELRMLNLEFWLELKRTREKRIGD